MKVYFLQWYDSEADDRRGGTRDDAEDFGVWLSEPAAQLEVDLHNARLLDIEFSRAQRNYVETLARQEHSRKEHEALVAAGLRSGSFQPKDWRGMPMSEPNRSTFKLSDFYQLGSYDVNDAPKDVS